MKEILKDIEEFKKGKSKEEIKVIDDLIVYLRKFNQTFSSEFGPLKNSGEFGPKATIRCKVCGK